MPSRLAIWSWCLYDFANSSFTTVMVTFVYAAYFTRAMAPDAITGTAVWSQGIAVSSLLVALLSPLMGVMADRGGFRKRFLLFFTGLCMAGCVALYFLTPGRLYVALLCFVVANTAFEMAGVFYNAFLPDLAPEAKIGRISGYGWGLGYAGGLLALLVALLALVQPASPVLGFSRQGGENIRATALLVAAWMALFTLPLILFVREKKPTKNGSLLRQSYQHLLKTCREISHHRPISRFLLARIFYNDGLITVFAFGGIYAAGTFGFSYQEILVFGIILNVSAGLGAFIMGHLDDRLGARRTIQISLWGLLAAAILAVVAPTRPVFWVAGLLIGFFAGPNQAASRSLLGRLAPAGKAAEFYGFFAFSGKATAFLGPMVLGLSTRISGSQRLGVATVILFFLAGLLLLKRVDEKAPDICYDIHAGPTT